MRSAAVRALLLVVLGLCALSALAQSGASSNAGGKPQGPSTPPKPPDIVCFGYGPNWSIQFVNGGARLLGINQPDQSWAGDFFWVPDIKTWSWHPTDPGIQNPLTAGIQKKTCTDTVRNWTLPYSASVTLPTGDMVSGCCRKLKPGEAAVGGHGVVPQQQQQ